MALTPEMERVLRVRNWTQETNPLGEIELTSPDREYQVQIAKDGYWALCKFTDGDLPNDAFKGGMEAVGRYESIGEGDTLAELEGAMVAVGAIPWTCDYCGEEGGLPTTHYSRELYGADYDGNRGEWREYEERRCSKCIGRS